MQETPGDTAKPSRCGFCVCNRSCSQTTKNQATPQAAGNLPEGINGNAFALKILQPHEGDTYYVGQTLSVEVEVAPEEEIEQLGIMTKNFEGYIFNNPPYKFKTTIKEPVDGKEPIGILAVLKNTKTILLSTFIYVKLPNSLKLTGILLENSLVVVTMSPETNGNRKIEAYGLFSNGEEYSLKYYDKVKFTSLDESIAKVDDSGVVNGVFPGETKVEISAGEFRKTIKVYVEYEVPPIKGLTVTGQKKSNVIKWDKSSYEGDIVSGYNIYSTFAQTLPGISGRKE